MLGVQIEGDLCPACRYKLKHQYKNKYEEIPIEKQIFQ